MTKLIVYSNGYSTFVMSAEDEEEFIGRMWGGEPPSDDGDYGGDGDEQLRYRRTEVIGPVEVETGAAEVSEVYDAYNI